MPPEGYKRVLPVQRQLGTKKDTEELKSRQALDNSEPILEEISQTKKRLMLAQAACLMALEGTTRATVTEILDRAHGEYQIQMMTSEAGQELAGFKLRRVTSHGRSRIVLDEARLREVIEGLTEEAAQMEAAVEEAIGSFGNMADRMDLLEGRLQVAVDQARREQDIRKYLQQQGRTRFNLQSLEHSYRQVRDEVRRAEQLEDATNDLQAQVKDLKPLEQTAGELQARVAAHRAKEGRYEASLKNLDIQERELKRREGAMSSRSKRLVHRARTLELAELDESVTESKKELDGLERRLGEKRSLLSKLLGQKTETS